MRHSQGRVVATVAIAAPVPEALLIAPLARHVARDWDDLDAEDKAAKNADRRHAEKLLLSSYDSEEHGTICIITETSAARVTARSPQSPENY